MSRACWRVPPRSAGLGGGHRQSEGLPLAQGVERVGAAAVERVAGMIFPAVQNLLLAARALGLGTTLTTLHRGFESDLKALLEVPAAVEVVAIVPLGHPADRFGPTRRRPVARVAFRDRWGKPFVAGGA